MASKSLQVTISGRDNGTSAMFQKVGLSADQSRKKIEEYKKLSDQQSKSSKGALGDVADSLGSRRTLSRVLSGGIAGLIGSQVEQATEKFKTLNEEIAKGQLDAAGITVKLGEALPILGSWVTAGVNIREAITGEQAAIDQITAATKLQNETWIKQLEIRKQLNDLARDDAKNARDFAAKSAGFGKEGFDKAEAERKAQGSNSLADIDDKIKSERDGQGATRAKISGKFDQQIADAQKAVESADNGKLRQFGKDRGLDWGKNAVKAAQTYLDGLKSAKASEEKELDVSNTKIDNLNKEKVRQQQFNIDQSSDDFEKAWKESRRNIDEHEKQTASLQAEAQAENLKSQNRGFEAEMLMLRKAGEDKKAEIQKQVDEQVKNAPKDQQTILKAQGKAQQDAVDSDTKAKAEAAAKKRKDEIAKQLRSSGEQSLEDQIAGARDGNTSRQLNKQLITQKLKDELADREDALKSLLNDPNATGSQKQQALNNLKQFAQGAGDQYDRQNFSNQTAANHLAQSSISNTLTGVGAEAAERGQMDLAKQQLTKTTDGIKVQQDMLTELRKFNQLYATGQNTNTSDAPLFTSTY